jgi:hypothetical protein
MQNILNIEYIVDDNCKPITMVSREGIWSFGFFFWYIIWKIQICYIFLGHPRPTLSCFYQKYHIDN